MSELTGLLIRLSVDRDGKAESPERHEADSRKLAASRGWTVAKVYIERDKSGYHDVKRPAFEELIRDLEAGRIKNVIAWDWSRITRRGAFSLLKFLETVKKVGGVVLTVHQQLDTSTPMGEGIAGFYAAQAKMESEATSRRVTGYHKERATNALPHNGGSRPYGHSRDGSIVPEEAETIRTLFSWIMDGTSRNECARRLNEQGIVTARGGAWSQSSVDLMLKQPRLTGYRTYHGQLIPGAYVPVFTEAEFADLQAMLKRTGTTRKALNEGLLLRNLLYCGLCGNPLRFQNATVHGKPLPRWACTKLPGGKNSTTPYKGCNKISIAVTKADALVKAEFIKILGMERVNLLPASEELPPAAPEKEILEGQLVDLTGRLSKWDQAFLSGSLESEAWQPGREKLHEEIKAVESRLEALSITAEEVAALPPPGTDIASWWESVSPERRRAAVVGALDGADVHPERNRPANLPRIKFRWKWSELLRVSKAAALPEEEWPEEF